jgi:hypothetical protein
MRRPRLGWIWRERSEELSEPVAGFQLWSESLRELLDDLIAGGLNGRCDLGRVRPQAFNDIPFHVAAPAHRRNLNGANEGEPADSGVSVRHSQRLLVLARSSDKRDSIRPTKNGVRL